MTDWLCALSPQMLATLLIFRQFLQNIKEVLQPYLYEQNKLGVFTPKVLWELFQAIVLKYGRLALGKAQASMTGYSFLGPRGIPVGQGGNPEPRRRGDLKAGFRLSEEEWDMSDNGLKQRKVSFTEKVDYQDVVTETQAAYESFLKDSPTLVEDGMDPSSIFDSCDEDSDCESLAQVREVEKNEAKTLFLCCAEGFLPPHNRLPPPVFPVAGVQGERRRFSPEGI